MPIFSYKAHTLSIYNLLFADSIQTDSRRSKPNSRAILTDEQSDLWDRLQPQDMTSRHRGLLSIRWYGLAETKKLLSPRYLSSLCKASSTRQLWTINPCFHTCLTCVSHSQATLCIYTYKSISFDSRLPLDGCVTI